MSTYTPNLNLFKIIPSEDAKKSFNFYEILNDNWDKIDLMPSKIQKNIMDIQLLKTNIDDISLKIQDEQKDIKNLKKNINTTNTKIKDLSNQIQSEIADILVTVHTELATTLKVKQQHFSVNGYVYLNNGLLTQWGITGGMRYDTEAPLTFPKSFLSTNYSWLNCCVGGVTGYNKGNRRCKNLNTTGLTMVQDSDTDDGCRWIAIGY